MEMITSPKVHQHKESPNPNPNPNPNASSPTTSTPPHFLPTSYTTFIQADTNSFKRVVQTLTGSSKSGGGGGIPPIKSTAQKKQGFKLYERRDAVKNGLLVNTRPAGFPHNSSGFSPRKAPEILSPSILDFPALALSPVTPLIIHNEENLSKSSPSTEEEKAIAKKKFYLHSSPMRDSEQRPRLLPLFPVTSPRISPSS